MPSSEPELDSTASVLILTPSANSHRRDFENVFKPESELLARAYRSAHCQIVRVPVAAVDPGTLQVLAGQRAFESAARAVLAATGNGVPWSHLIMLCHGWSTGLQLGFRTARQRGRDAAHFERLVETLKTLPLKSITLFACSAGADPLSPTTSPGSGDNSLADRLRDEVGVPVLAHATVGHATRNPDLILFEASPTPLIGGLRIPEPGSKLYRHVSRGLLGVRKSPGTGRFLSDIPPRGHARPVFASLPLCRSAGELQALLSSAPDLR
jgi:protein tyrosine phosphatase (PTP) superfamily phosphohydrolase (DUF442 family)